MKRITVKTLEQLGRAMYDLKLVANPKKLRFLTLCNKLTKARLTGLSARASIHSHGTANIYSAVTF